jgi:chromosome segregation ATPase
LFKFVNELSNDIESLEAQITDIKSEIDKYKGQGLSNDNQRKKILKDLEEKLSKTELRAEQFELEYQQALKKVNSIKASIENIFNLIDCNINECQELLGTQGVTESNMMTYLGVIEQRIHEIIQAFAYIQS